MLHYRCIRYKSDVVSFFPFVFIGQCQTSMTKYCTHPNLLSKNQPYPRRVVEASTLLAKALNAENSPIEFRLQSFFFQDGL